MAKRRKMIRKKNARKNLSHTYVKAENDLNAGKFSSVRKCAAHYKIPVSTLHQLYTNADEFQGSGRKSLCLSPEEEHLIINHVKERAQIGCGSDFSQLQDLVQKKVWLL